MFMFFVESQICHMWSCCIIYLCDVCFQNVHEFSDLPVRHNEDHVNSELAAKLPLSVDPHTYDSSNTKTHLLLQAHFSRVPLPSADYHTDTKSVMDQVLRVLQVASLGDHLLRFILELDEFCFSRCKWLGDSNGI